MKTVVYEDRLGHMGAVIFDKKMPVDYIENIQELPVSTFTRELRNNFKYVTKNSYTPEKYGNMPLSEYVTAIEKAVKHNAGINVVAIVTNRSVILYPKKFGKSMKKLF